MLLDVVMVSINKGAKIRFSLSTVNQMSPHVWVVERKLCLKDRFPNVTLKLLKEKGFLNLCNNNDFYLLPSRKRWVESICWTWRGYLAGLSPWPHLLCMLERALSWALWEWRVEWESVIAVIWELGDDGLTLLFDNYSSSAASRYP